jgi:antirestriction protein
MAGRETDRVGGSRVYVASLSDYNAGHLHGVWVDADQSPEELDDAVHEMLARSVEPDAEEYAIHDFEGFGAYDVHEYDSLELISRIAAGIRDHGIGYSYWADAVARHDPDLLDRFEDVYLGRWDSMQAFAEELLTDFGIDVVLEQIPEPWRWYLHVDTEALARDLAADYHVFDGPDGVHLFEPT